jgi:hypothetical protein
MDEEVLQKALGLYDASNSPEAARALARMKLNSMTAADRTKLMKTVMQQGGFSGIDMLLSRVEEKRHLPLFQIRDRPGEPFVNYICCGCNKDADDAPTQFLGCTKCKAVKYCDRTCQLRDWKGEGKGPSRPRPHRECCPEFAAARRDFAESKMCGEALRTELFSSWANQHHPKAGTFFQLEYLARRGLLGGKEKG